MGEEGSVPWDDPWLPHQLQCPGSAQAQRAPRSPRKVGGASYSRVSTFGVLWGVDSGQSTDVHMPLSPRPWLLPHAGSGGGGGDTHGTLGPRAEDPDQCLGGPQPLMKSGLQGHGPGKVWNRAGGVGQLMTTATGGPRPPPPPPRGLTAFPRCSCRSWGGHRPCLAPGRRLEIRLPWNRMKPGTVSHPRLQTHLGASTGTASSRQVQSPAWMLTYNLASSGPHRPCGWSPWWGDPRVGNKQEARQGSYYGRRPLPVPAPPPRPE